ncbi:MAG: anhydro-N-acetylmuramic acid kinase [Hyphomicrobiales bacterium]
MKTIIGTMSGTSMDGIDVAVLETDGDVVGSAGATHFQKYTKADRSLLTDAMAACREHGRDHALVIEADKMITAKHYDAIKGLMDEAGLTASDVDLVGFHGQTLYHAPQDRVTVQIGDGEALARKLGIRVAYDFRTADVKAGGEGAPLVPVFHQALVGGVPLPAAVLNIGGVANITIIGDDSLDAFDTGPGNALVDDWMRSRTSRTFDQWGRVAGEGTVDEAVLADLLAHSYFDRPAPKSLDRDAFDVMALDRASLADGAATLTAFSAHSMAKALEGRGIKSLYVAGGGANNLTMLRMLQAACGLEPQNVEVLGYDSDFLEAIAFAYLAARVEQGLPLTFPGTTGVKEPTTGGVLSA